MSYEPNKVIRFGGFCSCLLFLIRFNVSTVSIIEIDLGRTKKEPGQETVQSGD